jgi:hypothetical protein
MVSIKTYHQGYQMPSNGLAKLAPKGRELNTRSARIRENIRAGMIVTKLQEHIEGNIDMTATQVNAARILLNKICPDATDKNAGINGREIKDVSHQSPHDLLTIIDGESARK